MSILKNYNGDLGSPEARNELLHFWRDNPRERIYKAPCHMCAKDEVESYFEIDFDILGFRCHACGSTVYFGSFMNSPLVKIDYLFYNRMWLIDFSLFLEDKEKLKTKNQMKNLLNNLIIDPSKYVV